MTDGILSEAEAAFIQEQRVGRLATANEDGLPHVVPVCYAFDGAYVYTPLDEKPKRVPDRRLRRVRNIQQRPDVALLIDRYQDDWSRLAYVLIHGYADVIQPGDVEHETALPLLRARYPHYRSMDLEAREMILIDPLRVVSWGAIG